MHSALAHKCAPALSYHRNPQQKHRSRCRDGMLASGASAPRYQTETLVRSMHSGLHRAQNQTALPVRPQPCMQQVHRWDQAATAALTHACTRVRPPYDLWQIRQRRVQRHGVGPRVQMIIAPSSARAGPGVLVHPVSCSARLGMHAGYWTPEKVRETLRSRGPSRSTSMTLCHVPSCRRPCRTGMASELPSSMLSRWPCALMGS